MESLNKQQPPRIVQSSVIEPKDELCEKIERNYNTIFNLTNGLSEREANDALNTHVSKGSFQYEEVQVGLWCSILVDPKSAARSYRDLTLLSRDGMTIALTKTNQLIFERWLKLLDSTRQQIVWFCKELVKNTVTGAESVCTSLIRQMAGGDVSPKNIWLIEAVLDIFAEYRTWLDKFPQLCSMVVYTYLRLTMDHTAHMLVNLRKREVDLCVSLLREKWTDCAVIGRDLVRLLQYVARIPEVESLWKDMLSNPTSISPHFTGLTQLMMMRTSKKYLISRLTPDMENKLVFLITKVKFGQQKRYQDWFQRQYLSTPESQSLRCDLIRYICAVFHPPNELLCSDIIPRWAVIGWLLTTCTSNVAATNAKLALFYDWLFFDPERDSIMNIEPAILVMYHSIRPHPAITATLLDFLCRILTNFSLPLSAQVKLGIYTAFRVILDKRVLPALEPLLENSKLDRDLRMLIRENFTEFCSQEAVAKDEPTNNKEPMVSMASMLDSMMDTDNHIDNNLSDGAAFSDEEDDIPLGKIKEETKFQPIQDTRYQPVDINNFLPQLNGELVEYVEQLMNEKDQEIQCESMDRLMQMVVKDEEFDEMAYSLSHCLCQILVNHFSSNLFPMELDDESIEDSIGSPLFVIFRFLASMAEEDPNRQPILQLLTEMYAKQPRIGYHMLYFLKVGKANDEKMLTYKDFCKSMDNKDLESCLMSDLKLCQEDDVRLFTFLMPDTYNNFQSQALGNSELLHMIVSAIDGAQLQELICQILQGHLIMFRKDSFLSVLNASLDWETLEQYFLWQLISAHNIPVEHVMPILPKLDFTQHAEALSSILVLLKQECPSPDLLRIIMCRDCKKTDYFVVSILKYWAQEFEDKLAEHINQQVSKFNGTPKKRQRSGSSSKKDSPSIEQILLHLDHVRQVCKNISFLNNENIQHALQQVQQTASESLKTKFSDLLALAEDIDDIKSTRVLRGLPVRKAASASAAMGLDIRPPRSKSKKVQESSGSETESSSEEEIKPKPKKRKKALPVDDDSD
ncbi:integrator complex subunit 3-like isoform X1 [Mytilus californianus]|uniref:integrator complex subunit 3-like isoform X1 n=1 Tax=Mytilus californianus TaxID=6549 RepID=UPI00224512D9|nr:integrator complex subunit 3-like isoform X1 [Mytilus californianus]